MSPSPHTWSIPPPGYTHQGVFPMTGKVSATYLGNTLGSALPVYIHRTEPEQPFLSTDVIQLNNTLNHFARLRVKRQCDPNTKELSFCNKLWFSNPYIFPTRCFSPLIFQTMNSIRSNILTLKYQRFTSSDWKDIRIRKYLCVAKTQFLQNCDKICF